MIGRNIICRLFPINLIRRDGHKRTKETRKKAEQSLSDSAFVPVCTFVRDELSIELAITDRFRKSCKKGKVWNTPAMFTALKNAAYGFDDTKAMSPGGIDGIFLLTRAYYPPNEMMRKLFDRFIDKPGSGVEEIANALECPLSELLPVRLVSHHLRLLGLLKCTPNRQILVLVDYDDTK